MLSGGLGVGIGTHCFWANGVAGAGGGVEHGALQKGHYLSVHGGPRTKGGEIYKSLH